jgi:hypothetical protein
LDPVHPSHLQPAFDQALDVLRRHGGLTAFQRLGGRVLIALDDTLDNVHFPKSTANRPERRIRFVRVVPMLAVQPKLAVSRKRT